MKTEEITSQLERQRAYFASGRTLPVEQRIRALKRLKNTLKQHEEDAEKALAEDLGKSRAESYLCELGLVYSEIDYMLRHIRKFSKERRVHTPLAQTAARSYVKPSPKGNVLIMSPWNYPLMLTLDPLVDALAAGNTALVKPSAYAPHTSALIAKIVQEVFEPGMVSVVMGGRAENQQLLGQKFDHIFFTGSQAVGKEVLRQAAENLTPVSLELGGKSPCIVEKSANLRLAARRIVFGKFLNCGQTCVAPDYILCEEGIQSELENALVQELHRQFGEKPLDNPSYGKIVNQKHFERLCSLLEGQPIRHGGKTQPEALRMEPTILSPADWESPAMQEEIFGPILPILSYQNLEEAIEQIQQRPHPLALYLFSSSRESIRQITERCQFGGGCINDTVIHLATSQMGFGGVGASGMGAYHGKTGFDTFSHFKSIVDKKTWVDLPMRYQPYTALNEKLVKLFLR